MTRSRARSRSSSIGRRCKATVPSPLAGGQEPAVGTERHGVDGTVVAEQREHLPPGREIPELGGAIEAASGDERSVWAHGNAQERAGVPPQRRELPARLQVPDLRRPVQAGRDHLPVGRERDVLDDVGVATELSEPLEGIGVPHDQGLVADRRRTPAIDRRG